MQLIDFDQENFETALPHIFEVLKKGEMIIFPTETCYGIGVDATNKKAVLKLLEYKGGRENKAISVAVANKDMAEKYVVINKTAENIYQTLLPGPVTVISKSRGKVVKELVSDMGTLGIRIPDYPLLLKLIKALGKPITATSANTSGKKPPYSLGEWQKYTSKKKQEMVALFLDGGKLPVRPPSTLVDTTLNELTVLRQGEITIPHSALEFGSFTPQQTQKVGEEIMRTNSHLLAGKSLIIALQGELGAGKTQLAKGVAKALGIRDLIKSPTYTIVREYLFKLQHTPGVFSRLETGFTPGVNGTLFHIDTWRLAEGKELWDLGFEAMLKPGNVIIIEWLQKMRKELAGLGDRSKVIWIDFEVIDERERKIRVFKQD